MTPYAELLEFNQPNPIRRPGFTRIRDQFPGLRELIVRKHAAVGLSTEYGSEHWYNAERLSEFSGRWDYGANNAAKLGETSLWQGEQVPILQKYMAMGHESMLEMGWAAFFLEGSRVFSHEIVRHRPVSYQQESQRFVKYKDEEAFDLFFLPPELDKASAEEMMEAFRSNKALYDKLCEKGVKPQIARYVFPNATRTRLVMATNAREWRHILKLRLDKSAQPEMQQIMTMVYDQLTDIWPTMMKGVKDGERAVR
jgi:thymidylate synthase (FAD)